MGSQSSGPMQHFRGKDLGPGTGKGLAETTVSSLWSKDYASMQVSPFPAQRSPGLCRFRHFHKLTLRFLLFSRAWQQPCMCASLPWAAWLKSPDELQLHRQCCSYPSSKSSHLGGKLEKKVEHWSPVEVLRVGVSAVDIFTPCGASSLGVDVFSFH